MNIGDYVRTKDGKIIKVGGEELYDINLDSIKSSPNIIDLIEVGDYVNGYKVMDFEDKYTVIDEKIDDFAEKEGKFIVLGNEEGHYGVPAEGIKSIVTREMFESMEYKIGE